jgi:uncharacterized iron-regulated protein
VQARGDALLIAGRGHARSDRAVPFFLRRQGADAIVSVAFMDVSDGRISPADYDVDAFDFTVFTPRVSDEDPCETFRKQLEQMHRQAAERGNSPRSASPPTAADSEVHTP